MDAFAQAMQPFGFVQGRDYEIVLRSTESDPTRVPKLLIELIALNPKMILTTDTPLTLAVERATKEIPIVGVLIADPVGFGLVASVSHPGGNVTGLLSSIDRLVPKQLNLLLQVVPAAKRVEVLFNANNPANVSGMSLLQTDSAAQSLTLVPAGLHQPSEIDSALQGFEHQHLDALFVFQDGLFSRNAERIAASALAARLPSVFGFREFVEVGGLMSYGLNLVSQWQRAAAYVAKILQGTKPADLPVEMQPRLELVINLKTARELGITIPASVLAFADSLIE
jgi:putative ABC transport system substrate-binding protein